MSSTNTLTGINGELVVGASKVARVTSWEVNSTLATTNEWGDSDCAGFTARSRGRRDATFTADGKYDSTDEVYDLFAPGDTAIAVLWMDNTSLYWDFPRALCTDFTLSVDINTEDVIGWTSEWGADGVFYYPGESGATSRSLP